MKKSILLCCIAFLTACQPAEPVTDEPYEISDGLFVELQKIGGWDGKTIPGSQICQRDGGLGESPPLVIYEVPKGTNAIIVEYNDLDDLKLARDGGMGTVGYPYFETGDQTAVLRPVPMGELLPPYAFKERNHRFDGGRRGAYMAPCSRGAGHRYQATVKAVKREVSEETGQLTTRVLGMGQINLGTY